jgi:hypothetical protein
MPMIDEPPWSFLMTPAQHLQWAERTRRLAWHHEHLARAIEIAVVAASPRSPRPIVAPVDNPPRPDC